MHTTVLSSPYQILQDFFQSTWTLFECGWKAAVPQWKAFSLQTGLGEKRQTEKSNTIGFLLAISIINACKLSFLKTLSV